MKFRLSNKGLSIFVLFLGLLFGGRELPELMSLADDVSNDGEEIGAVYLESLGSSIDSQRRKVAAPASARVPVYVQPFTRRNFPQDLHPQANIDILDMISLRRE